MVNVRRGAVKTESRNGTHLSQVASGTRSQSKSNSQPGNKTSSDTSVTTGASPFDFLTDQSDDVACPCKVCSKMVGEEDSIQCDKCLVWVHQWCSKVNKSHFNLLTKGPTNFKWYCEQCLQDMSEVVTDVQLARQAAKLDSLMKVVHSLQQQNQKILKLLGNEERLETKIKDQVAEVMEDLGEKKDRKKNVVFFNIPENPDKEPQASNAEDRDNVANIIKELCPEFDSNSIEQNDVVRLGKKKTPTESESNPKARPLRVTIKVASHRNTILQNCRRLKNNKNIKFAKVGVAADKTQKERDADSALEKELKERRAKGENVVISKGRIVPRGNPPTPGSASPDTGGGGTSTQ